VSPAAATALLAEGAAAAGRERLLTGTALAVTTGQQAGLFLSPLYALHKALTAAALAEALSARWSTPVVPVFWVAGDDHDFAEVNHATVLGPDGRPAAIVLRERPPEAPQRPVFRELLGEGIAPALARLEALLPSSEFRGDAVSALARAYVAERSIADAYAAALGELLGPLGVVVCRGWDGGLKQVAGSVLLGAAHEAGRLDAELASVAATLRRAGRDVPVEVGRGQSLLMVEGPQGRDRLRIAGAGRFEARRGGESFDLAALEQLLARDPERLSANVLLRPAVEASVFPTVAYVGGPAELAYLAQIGPVFERLGVARPVRVPRNAGLLIEARVDRTLEKLGLAVDDLAQPESELTARVAPQDLPPAAMAALAGLREALTGGYASLQAAAGTVDRTLEKPVENARNQALVATQEIEKKLVAALKRGGDTALQQVIRAREALYPGGSPQERILAPISFTARYGGAVLEVLEAAARVHAARVLEGPAGEP
jgi:bacillithiol biosynthesis cysteine-adding enzyme BshC